MMGSKKRSLTTAEIQQIAGRAGRFGIYEEGFFTELGGQYIKRTIKKQVPCPETVKLSFPQSLINLDAKLSEILTRWNEVTVSQPFSKESVEDMEHLAEIIEKSYPNMAKETAYQFISIPFDIENEELLSLWRSCIWMEMNDKVSFSLSRETAKITSESELSSAEHRYKELDLLYQFCRSFQHEEWYEEILKEKHTLSSKIMEYLATSPLELKTCKYCHKKLPWHHKYSMCEACHNKMYSKHYNDYEDDYEDNDIWW